MFKWLVKIMKRTGIVKPEPTFQDPPKDPVVVADRTVFLYEFRKSRYVSLPENLVDLLDILVSKSNSVGGLTGLVLHRGESASGIYPTYNRHGFVIRNMTYLAIRNGIGEIEGYDLYGIVQPKGPAEEVMRVAIAAKKCSITMCFDVEPVGDARRRGDVVDTVGYRIMFKCVAAWVF